MRNSIAEGLMALVIGGFLGFLALFLREIGSVFSGVMAAILIAFYLSRRRPTSAGWLLVGGGLVPGLILGRNGLEAYLDPSIEVGPDTWLMLAVAFTVTVAGGLWILATTSWAPKARRMP